MAEMAEKIGPRASSGARTSWTHKTSGSASSIQPPRPFLHAALRPFKLEVEISVVIANHFKTARLFFGPEPFARQKGRDDLDGYHAKKPDVPRRGAEKGGKSGGGHGDQNAPSGPGGEG